MVLGKSWKASSWYSIPVPTSRGRLSQWSRERLFKGRLGRSFWPLFLRPVERMAPGERRPNWIHRPDVEPCPHIHKHPTARQNITVCCEYKRALGDGLETHRPASVPSARSRKKLRAAECDGTTWCK